MNRVKTCCSHDLFQPLIAWACVSAGTKKLFSLLSITSYSSFAFHKVSVTIYNSECLGAFLHAGAFCLTQPVHQDTHFSLSLPTVSNVKNVDPGKFPMHYCYCLNNVTNDLTGGYTREGDNCMCFSWIISFGAESCSLNSADFILTSGITVPRSTAITHEWLLWTSGETRWTQSHMAAPSHPVWDGAISQVTGTVYPTERPPVPPRNTNCSSVGKTTWQYMIRYFSHFRSPEITHRRWTNRPQ